MWIYGLWRLENFCVVVNSPVKIWSCTLSSKTSHLTILRLSHYFGTHLTIFAKYKYHFNFDKSAIALQPFKKWRIVSLFHPSLKNIAYISFFVVIKSYSSWMSFHLSVPQFDFLLLFVIERRASATCNMSQANRVVFGWFVDKCLKQIVTFEVALFLFFRLNMWYISRKQLLKFLSWFKHRQNTTHLQFYTSRYLFHIKSTLNY